MTARAQRVIAALLAANGEQMSSRRIMREAGVDKVSTAILEARGEYNAPIETCLPIGSGYKLRPDWSPDRPLDKTARPPTTGTLTDRGAKMLAMLEAAGGEWVSGKTLADPLAISAAELGSIAKHIMNKRPGVIVQGSRGRGYRLAANNGQQLALPAAAPAAAPALPGPPKLPPAPFPKHQARRATIDLIAALSPRLAELVRDIALETGTTVDRTIERLLSYGIEVHRDLIVHGEHPMKIGMAA